MLIVATTIAAISGSRIVAQAAPAAAAPPAQPFRGRLVGVFDEGTGEALAGVEIKNMLNGLSALTTATGTLTLFFVDTTGGLLSIRKLGYEPQTLAVGNSPRDSNGVTIVLKRTAQMLPTVVTKDKAVDSVPRYFSPALRGFEERRHQGFGHFVSEAQLRKKEGSRLSEIITANIPGAMTRPGRGGVVNIVGHRAGGSGGRMMDTSPCYITVYMDGVLYYSKVQAGGAPPPDFASLQANEYAGIEFYAGGATLPVQYTRTDAGCGTLLLWTRER
jgi:hypothetical protein